MAFFYGSDAPNVSCHFMGVIWWLSSYGPADAPASGPLFSGFGPLRWRPVSETTVQPHSSLKHQLDMIARQLRRLLDLD